MANDMHLGLMAPGIWYQMHQVVAGKLNVTGVGLPGAPFVIAGHNDEIAWGMTNVMVDDVDLYLETIHPDDTNQYLLDGNWLDMKLVEEKIVLKGEKEPAIRINRYTHRGPVVSSFRNVDGYILSARWQGREFSNELRSIYLLNRAGNWEQFRDALSTFQSVSQNIIYADRAGNIGLQTAAGIPLRKEGGILVYPGDTTAYDWNGTVPFEELPHAYNPECGHLSSANNMTIGEEYPHYIGAWFVLPGRIKRIRQMLDEKEIMGSDDFRRMLRDQTSQLAEDLTTAYLHALPEEMEGMYGQARQLLEQWDFEMHLTSAEALIFEMMGQQLIRVIFHDELGEEYYPLMVQNSSIPKHLIYRIRMTGESLWCDDVNTPEKKETFSDNITKAFRQTIDTLAYRYGNDPSAWQWGTVHQVAINHPLGSIDLIERLFKVNRGPFPVGGSDHTVCPFGYSTGSTFVSHFGASERHIFNTADWDSSLTVIPTGTSGIPASPHYMDQTRLYLENRYHRDLFSREMVEACAKYKAVFR
jgi:penicillin amidase